MNAKVSSYLACFALALSGIVSANDKFHKKCLHTCETCGDDPNCVPGQSTYESEKTYETQEDADKAPESDCKVKASNTSSNGGAHALGDTSPGFTSLNYKREGIVFDGVSPDYVKYETVSETTNGVTISVKKPVQLPTLHSTVFYTDLSDGSGYECAQYLNSQISAPNANGLRTIPAGVQPVSITIYRNPNGTANTNPGKLEIVHKQRHPQSGAWVTRTIRKTSPQGNNNWKTEFYLGDPTQNPTLTAYREITITRIPNPSNSTEESTREITRDRDSSGTLVTTSDISVTYGFYKYGEPVKLTETPHTGTASELTTTWTYFTAASDQASFNKPATMRRSDGQWANYIYQGSPVTGILLTKTVSGWLDQIAPAIGTAPDENASHVRIEIEAKNETGTYSREERIQGILVAKTWGERYRDNAGLLVDKSRVETGVATLTTVRTGYPNDTSVPEADRGRLKSIENPDGTVELHIHTLQGDNRTVTIDKGVGSLISVTDGTRNVSTYTKEDTLIKEVISDIASGIVLSTREAIAFDANDRPTRWAYDNDPDDYSETLNGCCGVDSTRTRDGIVAIYTRDGLKRPKTATSQGITLTYTYGRKNINGTDFPSVNITATAGNLTLDKGTTVHDHAGNVIQQISPDLDGNGNSETTTVTHNHSSRSTTIIHSDSSNRTITLYADGQRKQYAGSAVPDTSESVTVGINLDDIPGAVLKTTINRPSGTAAGDQVTATYQAVGGLTLVTQLNGITTATYTYDTLARLTLVTDGDGVKQHTAYNSKGEAYRHATSRDSNDTIDLGTDMVTDTVTDIADIAGFGPAIRRVTQVWLTANESRVPRITLQSPDGTKNSTTTLGIANPSITLMAGHLDRVGGSWTDIQNNPDGTKQTTTYENWLPHTQTSYSSLPSSSLLSSVSTTYDALRRPETKTDSRTGAVTTYYAVNGQVDHVDEHGHVTSFKYDSMGRVRESTLYDNTKTHTSYWPSGQVKAIYGSQTNPSVKLYTEQGQLAELRTFRSADLALAPDENTGDFDKTTWEYYPNGKLKKKRDAGEKGALYTYTPGGRLESRTWARGVAANFSYTHGLLTNTDYSDTTPDVSIVYDNLGRQQQCSNTVATTSFTYNPTTLALERETISYDFNFDGVPDLSRLLDRSRDNLGRDDGWKLGSPGPNGTNGSPTLVDVENTATYGYSSTTGRLETASGASGEVFTYSYEPNSHLIKSITRPGILSGQPTLRVTNTWDPNRDVLLTKANELISDSAITNVSSIVYTLNALSQKTHAARTGVSTNGTEWGYDSLGQVILANDSNSAADRAYQYDTNGNRLKSVNGLILSNEPNYAANALNQYTAADGENLPPDSFDADGNQRNARILPVGSTSLASCVYRWDAENRLTSVESSSGNVLVSYLYDAKGRLVARFQDAAKTIFLNNGWNRIAEYRLNAQNSSFNLAKSYVWGLDLSGSMQGAGGVGGLLAINVVGGDVRYPTYDGNGNISEYLTADGVVAAHFEYDPFGNAVVNTDVNGEFEYRFSTKPVDAATGLYYYGYRWYDSIAGRWPSRDPIEEDGGLNLYGFVRNMPTLLPDLLGMKGWWDMEGAAAIVGSVELNYSPCTGNWELTGWLWAGIGFEWNHRWVGYSWFNEKDKPWGEGNWGALFSCGKCKSCCGSEEKSDLESLVGAFKGGMTPPLLKKAGVECGLLFHMNNDLCSGDLEGICLMNLINYLPAGVGKVAETIMNLTGGELQVGIQVSATLSMCVGENFPLVIKDAKVGGGGYIEIGWGAPDDPRSLH